MKAAQINTFTIGGYTKVIQRDALAQPGDYLPGQGWPVTNFPSVSLRFQVSSFHPVGSNVPHPNDFLYRRILFSVG